MDDGWLVFRGVCDEVLWRRRSHSPAA